MWRRNTDDVPSWHESRFGHRRGRSRSDLIEVLSPLIGQIARVDDMAARLRTGGACVADLTLLGDILTQEISLDEDGRARKVSLTQPAALREALYWINPDLHLEVHQYKDQLPCYLLGRLRRHWPVDLLLEELYVSPRNDFFPDCFVTLKRTGESRVALRLSSLRQQTVALLGAEKGATDPEAECDEVLDAVGTLVFNAAWYEDQRLAFRVADTFSLCRFRSTLELVAFALGADLHFVATGLFTAPALTVRFFADVYENEYLSRVLMDLHKRKVPDLNRLEDTARAAFERLNSIFGSFLGMKGAIRDFEHAPLYHVVLGSFFDLGDVAGPEFWTPECKEAIERVEAQSKETAERILGVFG